jgi:hypothetical protein
MNAAAIGLIGVIVGGLLAGFVSLILDRRTRLAKARVAGRLIAAELGVAETKVTSALKAAEAKPGATNGSNAPKPHDGAEEEEEERPAVDATGWWIGDLPADAWKKHRADLAIEVSSVLLQKVSIAYALSATLNDQHAAARLSDAGPEGDLASYARTFRSAKERLADESKVRPRKVHQQIVRWSPGLAVITAVIVVAIIAIFAPRAEVNSATVSAALQSRLGHSVIVQCDPNLNSEWDCTAYPHSWSTLSASGTASVRQAIAADNALTIPALDPSTSASIPRPITFTADVNGAEVRAAVIEQDAYVDQSVELDAKLPTNNAWKKFLKAVAG